MQTIKVYHFHNGGTGGVLSVIKNLLKFSSNTEIENHLIYTINKATTPVYEPSSLEGAKSQQVFYYSPKWNFYYTCRQLAKLLPNDSAVVVAHDWLELGMISNLGLQNPVVEFLHGDYGYYYQLAKKHDPIVNDFIAVSPVIYNKLSSFLLQRSHDIHYCRFPVPPSVKAIKNFHAILKIFYCVRLIYEDRKQFKMLPLINERLQSKNLTVQWTIIGEGSTQKDIQSLMGQDKNISYFSFLPNEEVIRLLSEQDIFILPSLEEGFPVSMVEAMKAGVVPLVTDWSGATDELIEYGKTGFYLRTGDADAYANMISLLNSDRKLLKEISIKASAKADALFDPAVNTQKIEEVIISSTTMPRDKKAIKAYGSRLDAACIPNFVTQILRSIGK